MKFFIGTGNACGISCLEMVYQGFDGRVGFDVDENSLLLLSHILSGSWRWNKVKQTFVLLNDFNQLAKWHIAESVPIAIINPNGNLLNEFDQLRKYNEIQRRNELLVRLKREPTKVDVPLLHSLIAGNFPYLNQQSLIYLCSYSDVIVMLASNEHGLQIGLFSDDVDNICIILNNISNKININEIESNEEFPCW